LLLATLVALGPLVRVREGKPALRFGLTEFPI